MAAKRASVSIVSTDQPTQNDVPQLTAMVSVSSLERFQRVCDAGGFQMSALLRLWVDAYLAGRGNDLPHDPQDVKWPGMCIGAAPEKVRFKVDESTAESFKKVCLANKIAMSKALRVWIESFSWQQLQADSNVGAPIAQPRHTPAPAIDSNSSDAYFRLRMPEEARKHFADSVALEGRAPTEVVKAFITAYGLYGEPSLSIAGFAKHQQVESLADQAEEAMSRCGLNIPEDFDPKESSDATGVRVMVPDGVFKAANERAGQEGTTLQILGRLWAAAYAAGALDVGPIFDLFKRPTRSSRTKPQLAGALPAIGSSKTMAVNQAIDIVLPEQLKLDFFARCDAENRVPQTLLLAWMDLYINAASSKTLPGPVAPPVEGRTLSLSLPSTYSST